jgi:hypothetical protein
VSQTLYACFLASHGCRALLGHGGRWERWEPPAAAAAANADPNDSQQWQLMTSGQSVYAFQPGENPSCSITVHVMEAADPSPVRMTECMQSAGENG